MTAISSPESRAASAVSKSVPRPKIRADLRSERRAGWAMAAPAVLLLLAFLIVPVILGFVLSFTNARLISPEPTTFTGLDNFVRAFTADPTFFRSLLNTFAFAAVVVPVQAGFGLVLAILVNQKIRGVVAFRVIKPGVSPP